jgi:hypothetical protein
VEYSNQENIKYPQEVESLKNVIDQLRPRKNDAKVERNVFSFDPAKNPIETSDLRELVDFPYEFSIMGIMGRIFVETGDNNSLETNVFSKRKMKVATVDLHTHPANSEVESHSPSFNDIFSSTYFRKETPLIIASSVGLIIYHGPRYNPITKESFSGDPRDLAIDYAEAQGICLFPNPNSKPENNLKYLKDMSPKEISQLERHFAEDTKAIESDIPWEDKVGIQKIINIINLTPDSKLTK